MSFYFAGFIVLVLLRTMIDLLEIHRSLFYGRR